jgi:hypothetical protein
VYMEGDSGVRADGANQVGKEKKVRNKVRVGRVEVEGIGEGREPAYGCFEVSQIGGPERDVGQEALTG